MKKKILWMLLSFLLVASLVLASCAKEEVVVDEDEDEDEVDVVVDEDEEEEEEEVVEPAVGEPQYGGTVTIWEYGWESAHAGKLRDPASASPYMSPVVEHCLRGDFETYGPRGTGEFGFTLSPGFIPTKFCTGAIAESWEVTTDRIVLHIRPEITWAAYGKEHVMEPRELTAEDVAWALNRIAYLTENGSLRAEVGGWIGNIYAEGNSVIVEFDPFHAHWQWRLIMGWANEIDAPEVLEYAWGEHIDWGSLNAAEAEEILAKGEPSCKWEDYIGTGPWMVKEFVDGSHITYERNPNYWGTTTINGVEYDDIPFIDELVYPVILDESTRISALRTGKLDAHLQVPLKYEDTLAATSPELLKNKYARDGVSFLVLMPDREPFIKKEVRQALMIAIDRQAILNAVYGSGVTHAWPVSPTLADVYTPFDQLSASTQELLTYDPDRAKKMLIDAGCSEGFEIELIYGTEQPYDIDIASMAAYYWDEIGVTAIVTPLEQVALEARWVTWDFDVAVSSFTSGSPIDVFSEFLPTFPGILLDQYDNPYFVERYWEASETVDIDAQNAIWKELSIILLDDAPVIPIGMDHMFSMWWPWLKNYYGETNDSNWGIGYLMGTAWIDHHLKAEH